MKRKANYIVLWLLMFSCFFALFQFEVVAQEDGAGAPPGYTQEEWEYVQTQLFQGRVTGFNPITTNQTIAATQEVAGSKLFDLSGEDMPPVRVTLGGVNWVNEVDLGQIIQQVEIENGTLIQANVFAKKYFIDMDLLFETEINKNYISGVGRADFGAYILEIGRNILGSHPTDPAISRAVTIPNYQYPSNWEQQANRIAEGFIQMDFNLDTQWTFAPAETINGTTGIYRAVEGLNYWIGITGVQVTDPLVPEGVTGEFRLNPLIDQEVDPPSTDYSAWPSNGRTATITMQGKYNGVHRWIEETISNGTWDSETVGTPLEMAVAVTNQTYEPNLPFYNASLGPQLTNVRTQFYMKLQPKVYNYIAEHSIDYTYGRIQWQFWGDYWYMEMGYPHYATRTPQGNMGFTFANVFRKQRIQVELTTQSYYQFEPYQQDQGYLDDPNEIVGDLAKNVWGSGDIFASASFALSPVEMIWTLITVIVIAGVVIAVLYFGIKAWRSRKASASPIKTVRPRRPKAPKIPRSFY